MKKAKIAVLTLFAILTGVYLVCEPEYVTEAVRRGLLICADTVIPSLFPFLVLSSFLSSSGIAEKAGRLLEPMSHMMFGLSGSCAAVILMSFIGGYPTGARMACELQKNGSIDPDEGRRMMRFCVNAGPAFLISGVGYSMLGSKKAGAMIYLSMIVSSCLLGVMCRSYKRDRQRAKKEAQKAHTVPPVSDAFVEATASASAAMFSICAWVLTFQTLTSCLRLLSMRQTTGAVAGAILEVTSGLGDCVGRVSIPVLCALLSFGGIAVHFQLMKYISAAGMKYAEFFLFRLLHAVLSGFVSVLMFRLFPCDMQTFSNGVRAVAYPVSVSIPAAAALMMMCGIFILGRRTNH